MEGFLVSFAAICIVIFLCWICRKNFNEEQTDSAYLNVSRDRTSSEERVVSENHDNIEISLNNLVKQNINSIIEKNSFSYVSEIKDGNCIICLDDMEKGEEIRALRCMHKFHKNCIDDWLERQNFETLLCPICESPIMEFSSDIP